MLSVRLAMVKSSESELWYMVGTLAPICLTRLSSSPVFMLPGGPAIILIDPRRNDILWSSKMGQGVGSGSPAETPRLTVRWSVLMIASSEGGPEGPPVLLDQPSRTLTLYLNGLFCFERSLTTYLVPSSAGEEASIRASFSFSRWSLVTSQSVLKDSKPSSLEPFFSFLPTTSTGMTISRSGWKAFSTFSSSGSKVPSPLGWYLSASANFTSHTFWPCWFFCGTSLGSPV